MADQAAKKDARKKKKKISAPTHHLRFFLVDEHFKPITEPRKYTLSWKVDKEAKTVDGQTDASGATQLVETAGPAWITLELAPPDGDKCETVGSATTKPNAKNPEIKVQLKSSGQATSEVKANNACVKLEVREGKQKIQFVINNVPRYHQYSNYLQNLPYYLVDAKTLKIISDDATPPKAAFTMEGSDSQVSTKTFDVDGIESVGIVLGGATDDPSVWGEKKLVLYKTTPKDDGLTQVVITEKPDRKMETKEAITVTADYKATLNGNVWAQVCRTFTVDDLKKMFKDGGLAVSTTTPTERQIDYAVDKKIITPEIADKYRAARKKKPAPVTAVATAASSASAPDAGASAPKAKAAEPLPPLSYACTWIDLLTPIYTGKVEDVPPNPQIRLPPNPKTHKYETDPATNKPKTKPQYSDEEYTKLTSQGDGKIYIDAIGLTIELSGRLGTGHEPCSENAQEITGLDKSQVIAKTHPYAYLALIESAANCSVNYVRLGCTWRPMLGSVFHKLGNALDVGNIDSESDNLTDYEYNHTVDALAKKFDDAIKNHRYVKAGAVYYNHDPNLTRKDHHDDHMHVTVDGTRAVADQDRTPVSTKPL